MKVALIGNMNNNNFSIMRYLRDFGIDAHLIITKDDGVNSLSHFAPEYDTWEIEKWKPFIHHFEYSQRWALFIIRKQIIKSYFKSYDILIGSALIPAIMYKSNISLDIYYPYATGIEFVGEPYVLNGYDGAPFYKRVIKNLYKKYSIEGIKKSKICLSAYISLTDKTFNELGVNYKKIPIPMVYNREITEYNKVPGKLKLIDNLCLQNKNIFFCHVRHDDFWKNHEPYLNGYSKFIKLNPNKSSVLLLVEYGNDVQNTKRKILDLGIENNVIWLPKLARKEILLLLESVNLGFNNFNNEFWGGTGWEFLSKGVPFFHSLHISAEEYTRQYNTPMPNFINTESSDEICEHLIKYSQDPEPYKKIGIELKDWFNKYGGIGLAEVWKEIIIEIYNKKQINATDK